MLAIFIYKHEKKIREPKNAWHFPFKMDKNFSYNIYSENLVHVPTNRPPIWATPIKVQEKSNYTISFTYGTKNIPSKRLLL